jgi:hypothetical protein
VNDPPANRTLADNGAEPGAPFEITPAEREELAEAGVPVRQA